MPKGHDSVSFTADNGAIVTCDYTWHRWTEHHPFGDTTVPEEFFEWDIVALYINDQPATKSEVALIAPAYDTEIDQRVRQ